MDSKENSIFVTLLVTKAFVPQENKTKVFVYCPELDGGGVGDSREEAERRFRETLKLNVTMAKSRKTLKNILFSLGWTEKNGQLTPPEITVEKTTVTL